MKKGCCSEGLQAFLLCLFLLNTPKKEAAWIALIFGSAAVVGGVKQLFEAVGEALKKIYLCHQLFLKGNKVCKKYDHIDEQEAAGDWPKEISAATKVWLCGEGWWGLQHYGGVKQIMAPSQQLWPPAEMAQTGKSTPNSAVSLFCQECGRIRA